MKLKDKIGEKMVVKWDEEVTSLVGIQIHVTENGFCLQQPSLIRKLLSNDGSGMRAPTPLAALRRLISYVRLTQHFELKVEPEESDDPLKVFVDASWMGKGAVELI
ncbi:uncharacterized protein VP01_2953g1 [Puccinia sorghi]|uniref:Uncharacterized protein n=1 Tax=Puccinia sorghi TaxID=27349 RepID=A0A0L6V114_9BASI|nr:uncharacterized protein VP01_2953g1 [Puccinia sorghi]